MAGAGFGEHLKREREMRGVSLDEIAAATRISTRFLEALELEAWNRLPGGVFNRGFVRTVARFLGLEEEALLAEYSLATGKPESASPAPAPARLPPNSLAEPARFPWMAVASIPIVLALATGGWLGWQAISARRAQLNAVASSVPPAPAPPSAPSALFTPAADSVAPSAISPQDPPAAASPWADSAQGLQLKIDAAKDTNLTITADGQQAFAGAISAGQSRTINARTTLTLETQDAGAVRLELNGQALAPMGPSGQPGRITFGHPSAPTDAGGHD
jgi:cytoskeleton protein RodZ